MFYEFESGREFCNCGSLMKCESTFRHRSRDYNDSCYIIEIFEIFACPACNEVTLMCYSALGNDDEDEINDDPEKELHREFRRTILHAPNKQLDCAIPQSIAEVTYQAQAVLSKSPRASFILCRAVLEEICNDFKIPNKNQNKKGFISLGDRLKTLFEQQQMTEDLKNIVQGIKELGNNGAHSDHLTFTTQVKVEDADNLLVLLNYVIERLYVDKDRQEKAGEILSRLKAKILPSK